MAGNARSTYKQYLRDENKSIPKSTLYERRQRQRSYLQYVNIETSSVTAGPCEDNQESPLLVSTDREDYQCVSDFAEDFEHLDHIIDDEDLVRTKDYEDRLADFHDLDDEPELGISGSEHTEEIEPDITGGPDVDMDTDMSEETQSKPEFENWNKPLYKGASSTLGQTILLLIAFVLTAGLTQEALSHLLQMLAVLLPPDSLLPVTEYFFKKYFKKNKFCVNLYCPECSTRIEESLCSFCNQNYSKDQLYKNGNFFITVPLVPQFKHILETLNLGKKLNYRNNRPRQQNSVDDIYDGYMYKHIYEQTSLKKEYSFSLTLNSDGIPVFKSSAYSIWPIMSFINELPPQIRKKFNLILSGLWFGEKKPVITTFFKPFIDEINVLSSSGFNWYSNGNKRLSYVSCLICSCDSVARAMFQNIKQFNGKYGCNWCLHPGQRVEKWKGTVQIYPCQENEVLERKHEEMISHAQRAHTAQTDIYGVKGPTPFILIPQFNLVSGFIVDYMHCVDLGIMKQLSTLWFDSIHHKEQWYIGTQIKDVDSKLNSISPTSNITRLPRSVKVRAYWKASEWRAFLLFYAPLVLKSVHDV